MIFDFLRGLVGLLDFPKRVAVLDARPHQFAATANVIAMLLDPAAKDARIDGRAGAGACDLHQGGMEIGAVQSAGVFYQRSGTPAPIPHKLMRQLEEGGVLLPFRVQLARLCDCLRRVGDWSAGLLAKLDRGDILVSQPDDTLAHEIVPNLVAAQLVFRGARAASRDETAQQGEAGRNEFLPVLTAVCQRIESKTKARLAITAKR